MKALSIDTLGDLNDGHARAMINAALRDAIRDLEDRGREDGKARKVTITVEFEKTKDDTVCSVSAAAKLPEFRTGATIAKPRLIEKDGRRELALHFQEWNAENPDQATIYDEETGEVIE